MYQMAPEMSIEAASVQATSAEFIHDAAQCIDEFHWFCLCGEFDYSLCIQTMLSLQEYATMMHVANPGLVLVGKRVIEFSEETCREFLHGHELRQHGKLGIAEITINRLM